MERKCSFCPELVVGRCLTRWCGVFGRCGWGTTQGLQPPARGKDLGPDLPCPATTHHRKPRLPLPAPKYLHRYGGTSFRALMQVRRSSILAEPVGKVHNADTSTVVLPWRTPHGASRAGFVFLFACDGCPVLLPRPPWPRSSGKSSAVSEGAPQMQPHSHGESTCKRPNMKHGDKRSKRGPPARNSQRCRVNERRAPKTSSGTLLRHSTRARYQTPDLMRLQDTEDSAAVTPSGQTLPPLPPFTSQSPS